MHAKIKGLLANLKATLVHYFVKKWPRVLAGLIVTALFCFGTLGYYQIPGIDRIENYIYDVKVRLSARGVKQPSVVILDIDEKSLAAYGRWPWDRSLLARINDKLFDEYQVSALGYDVVWAERDSANPTAIAHKLDLSSFKSSAGYSKLMEEIQRKDSDRVFAESLKGRKIVLGYYFNNEDNAQETNVLPAPVLDTKALPQNTNQIVDWKTFTGNLPELTENAISGGYFNPLVDPDGLIRRVPLLAHYDGHYYQSLTLGLVRAAFGQIPLEPIIEQADDTGYIELEQLRLGPIDIPVASDGTMLVPYRGKAHTFPYLSIKDLMDGKVKNKDLQGKIVIMGSSAPGLRDQRSVPVQNVFPGVEIHANVVDGILSGNIVQEPAWGYGLEFIQLLLAGIILALILPALGALSSLLLTIFFLAVGWGFNYYLWSALKLDVPIAADFSALILIFMTDIVSGYFTEGRKQKNMESLFGQYVPPELVKKMADDPLKYSMAGRNAEMTVLFSDIRGFTAISESLTATQLAAYINEYLTNMSQIISEDEGTLDKYIGDAIMAFWGAPVDNAKHASFAIKSALRMSEETDRLAESFKSRGLPAFNIGIGLNAGNMVVGDMGSSYRKNYTVMGDPVNLASRLEGLTKYYGLRILVGESVKALTPEYLYREIDRVKVKGKETVVTIYTPIGLASEITSEIKKEIEAWSEVLAEYYAGKWSSFDKKLKAHIKAYGTQKLYEVYTERVVEFKKNPPPANWGGVYAFNEK